MKFAMVVSAIAVGVLALAPTSTSGFAFVSHASSKANAAAPLPSRKKMGVLHMSDDEPSDTSSDVTVDVPAETYEPTEPESIVSSIFDLLPTGPVGVDIDSDTRANINEAIIRLESLNPTSDPACSPLVNGIWILKYSGGYASEWTLNASPTRQLALFLYSGGYSPGLFVLSIARKLPGALVEVGDVEVTIARDQPRIESKIVAKFLNEASETEISVKARLEVESGVRMVEKYESASIGLFDQSLDIPEPLRYSRDLYVTYVDEDVLVVRDASGVPEILVRKNKEFSQVWGTEPSEVEEMVPPGEELPATD